MKRMIKAISLSLLGCAIFYPDFALAQSAEPFAYPSKGQSSEQQQQDHYACYSWAKQQTGVDPAQISTPTVAQSSHQGGLVRGAARGSLLGVVGGAIGGNVGEGAAIGAGVGALSGLMRRREEERTADQAATQANAQEHQQLQQYYQAWTACMEGRGYTVN